jgi:hypothetical protein
MHDLEGTGRDRRQPDQLDADDGCEHDVADSCDAGRDHDDTQESADPKRRRAQNLDAGPAVIDRHAILLISAMIGTLGNIAPNPQIRHPTKP